MGAGSCFADCIDLNSKGISCRSGSGVKEREREVSAWGVGVGRVQASHTTSPKSLKHIWFFLATSEQTELPNGIPRLVQTKQSPLYTYKHITSLLTWCISSNYHRMGQSKFSICTHRTCGFKFDFSFDFLSNENSRNCAADIRPKAICCFRKYK